MFKSMKNPLLDLSNEFILVEAEIAYRLLGGKSNNSHAPLPQPFQLI